MQLKIFRARTSLGREPVSPHVEDATSLAFLIARDGSPELRQEQAAWMKNTFALSFSDT